VPQNFKFNNKDKQKINLLIKYAAKTDFPIIIKKERLFDMTLLNTLNRDELIGLLKKIIKYQNITGLNLGNLEYIDGEKITRIINTLLLLCNESTIEAIKVEFGELKYDEINFKDFYERSAEPTFFL